MSRRVDHATDSYPPDAMRVIQDRHQDPLDVQRRADLRWVIARMEPALRAVAEARWVDGMSKKETQERLGVTRWELWRLERQAKAYLWSELVVA